MTSIVESSRASWPTDAGESVTPDEFKAVFRRHPAGVAVIATWAGDRPVGFSATSVISVSAAPPIVAFSVQNGSSSWAALAVADTLAISLLSSVQADVSARFATRGIDRFAGGDWHRLPSGEPVINDAVSWLRGVVLERIPVGGSYLVAARVVASGAREDSAPLVYHDRVYHRLDASSAL